MVVRRDLDDSFLDALESEAGLARLAGDARWLLVRGRRAEVCTRWLGAARLAEHGLPTARPALFVAASTRTPRGALAVFERPASTPNLSADELCALLAERGLVLEPFETFVASGPTGAYFLPPHERALRAARLRSSP